MGLKFLIAALVAISMATTTALAAPKDAVLNKAGVWGIDVDGSSCAASMTLKDGSIFLLRAVKGNVNLALFGRTKLRKSKTARLETEAYGLDFEPAFTDERDGLYTPDFVSAETLAALRPAREVRIVIDRHPIMAATLEGTGFDEALDGLITCSKGESGWWGKGVPATETTSSELVRNAEGYWTMEASEEGAYCRAGIVAAGGGAFLLLANSAGDYGIGVQGKVGRGRKGVLQTEAFTVDFKPTYGGKDYVYSDDPIDSPTVFALRRAKALTIRLDGRLILDIVLQGTGHDQVMTDIFSCAKGQSGWWGKGAPPG